MTSTQQLSLSEFKTSVKWEERLKEDNPKIRKDFSINKTTGKIPVSVFLSNSKILIQIEEAEKIDHVYLTLEAKLAGNSGKDWVKSTVIQPDCFKSKNSSLIAEAPTELIDFTNIPSEFKEYGPVDSAAFCFAITLEFGLKMGAKLFMKNEFCDVKIFCEEKIFESHKLVLASQSEVFKSMLITSKMSETTSGEIKITDISAYTIHNLLFFLYHGELGHTKITGSLLVAAEKYELLDLVSYCVKTLMENLNEENAVDVMISAHLVNQKALFHHAAKYIFKSNLKDKMKKTDQWKDFQRMYPTQALEMLTSAIFELHIEPCDEFQRSKTFPANLLMEDEFSDVKIFCGEKIFNCHKLVLATQSEVFRGMLVKGKAAEKTSDPSTPPVYEEPPAYEDPTEQSPSFSQTTEIKITDTSSSTMFNLLFFLYHGKLDKNEISGSLLAAAEKHKLTALFNICERYLMENLSEKNVVEVLISTYMINKRDVFGHACKFIFKNNLNDKIVKTEEWCNFQENNPTQALELLTEAMFQ